MKHAGMSIRKSSKIWYPGLNMLNLIMTCDVDASPEEEVLQLGARLHDHLEAGVLHGDAVRQVQPRQPQLPPAELRLLLPRRRLQRHHGRRGGERPPMRGGVAHGGGGRGRRRRRRHRGRLVDADRRDHVAA